TNIAFPDWIMDNAKLDLYYKSITFDPTKENYYDIWTKLTIFNIEVQYKHLTMATADYDEFFMPPGIVNAWYHPTPQNGVKRLHIYIYTMGVSCLWGANT
ncbi:hypothetical protein ANCDUO_25159, partial [Ancylostoma duodenale]